METRTKSPVLTRPLIIGLLAGFCCLLWGSAIPFINIGYRLFGIGGGETATQIHFAGCRFFLAGLLTIAFASVPARRLVRPARRNLHMVAVLAHGLAMIQRDILGEPADPDRWAALVKATLSHLKERYGAAEVSAWPCEVWNEPNLDCFWENADKAAYLRLYEVTARAVKAVLPEMPVGGPAICGGEGSQEWVRDFLAFCLEKQLPVDFVSRHAYMGLTPFYRGRYLYHEMRTVEDILAEMRVTREIIDSFPEYRGLPMHITEFNTSYNPFCPIHDTNLNAAYIAGLLSCLGDVADSYSYWTFGDVFEESGVPSRPFHGGFGLMAGGLIPKPTLWTFAFFNNLRGEAVHRDERSVILRREDGSWEGVLWNLCREEKVPLTVSLSLPGEGEMTLLTRQVDEEGCNPLAAWHMMGEPASLSREQLHFLRQSAQPRCGAQILQAADGYVRGEITLGINGVTHFTLTPRRLQMDYGYDAAWYKPHV